MIAIEAIYWLGVQLRAIGEGSGTVALTVVFVVHNYQVRTFGVEEEFLIVDPVNGLPLPLSAEVMGLHGASDRAVGPSAQQVMALELHQEQLEVITRPHSSLAGLAAEVLSGRAYADSLARKAGARIVALATCAPAVTPRPTPNERYDLGMLHHTQGE